MKKVFLIVLLILVVGAIGGYIWWQQNKKKIIKNAIENAITKKTDSLYTVRYDSSKIDELNGNASFFNVSLQSDGAQKELLASTDSLPNSLFLIKVKQVSVLGVDIPGLMQNKNITAQKIFLYKPVVQIINTGAGNNKPYSAADTLELFERILGKFSSIKVDGIQIDSGQVIITDRNGKSLTTLENINITLNNFLVDSLHNYENVISYFIKDVKASVENIQLPEAKNRTRINITKLNYDALAKTLTVKQVQQYKPGIAKPVIELNDIGITKLNTDVFILNQQLKAGMVTCEGGLITIYKKEKGKQTGSKAIGFTTDFDAVQVDGMKLGKTKVVIIDETDPSADPFVLNDVQFNMTRGLKVFEGNTLSDIISYADWKLTSSGFTMLTKSRYTITAKALEIDNVRSGISLGQVAIRSNLREDEFFRQSVKQLDRYEITFNNIKLNAVNFKRLIGDNAIEADNASLNLVLKISRDRTKPEDTASKVGNAPYQLLMKMKTPVHIGRVQVSNSLIEYAERGSMSRAKGVVSFQRVNGLITNVTNIPERIKQNGTMKLIASGKFLGQADINTTWLMPLTLANGNFTVTGKMGPMNALALNPLIEPLAMTSVKSGMINKTEFVMNGNDHKATTDVLFTYNDLKLEMLKKDDANKIEKKDLMTLLANLLIHNNNPSKGKAIRRNEVTNDRQLNRSFFNLIWQTIFKGLKKTTSRI